jgi:hypothetical protein
VEGSHRRDEPDGGSAGSGRLERLADNFARGDQVHEAGTEGSGCDPSRS